MVAIDPELTGGKKSLLEYRGLTTFLFSFFCFCRQCNSANRWSPLPAYYGSLQGTCPWLPNSPSLKSSFLTLRLPLSGELRCGRPGVCCHPVSTDDHEIRAWQTLSGQSFSSKQIWALGLGGTFLALSNLFWRSRLTPGPSQFRLLVDTLTCTTHIYLSLGAGVPECQHCGRHQPGC